MISFAFVCLFICILESYLRLSLEWIAKPHFGLYFDSGSYIILSALWLSSLVGYHH